MRFWRALLLLTAAAQIERAQQGGFVSGVVRDASGGAVAKAEVRIQNENTGARQSILTDPAGFFQSSELAAGSYKITVRCANFRTEVRPGSVVVPGKAVRIDFTLQLLPLEQEVTVTPSESAEDPVVSGVIISRDSRSASLPLNGRDVHALFRLIPGATETPASVSSGGQFTVGGQRPNTNSFRVDGINANMGIGVPSIPGDFPGGSLPAMTTIGGTQTLASKEELERVELRSADFSAQHGDRPGAQVDIQTRSGSNEFHGSLLGYIRPSSLDSQDWFARQASANLPSASVKGWGGSLSGPLQRSKTYFFAAFERSGVHDDAMRLIPVPSEAARKNANSTYQAILSAFPEPTGMALTANESVGRSPLEKAAAVTNSSIRVDRVINEHAQAFARVSDVPSNSTSIELGAAYSEFQWMSATGGLNLSQGAYVHEFRFNYAESKATSAHGPADTPELNNFVQILNNTLLQYLFSGSTIGGAPIHVQYIGSTQVSVGGIGQTVTGPSGGVGQHQFDGTYVVSKQAGKQMLSAGGEYTALSFADPVFTTATQVSAISLDQLLAGVPLGITYSSFSGPSFRSHRWSLFAQDSIHVTNRLDFMAGMRWEFTPAPNNRFQSIRFPYIGYWNGLATNPVRVAGYQLGVVPTNPVISADETNTSSNWPMRYDQLAPRVGAAYHLPKAGIVLRAGAGFFYDTQMVSIVANESPLNVWQYLPTSSNPTSSTLTPANLPLPLLYLPRVLEWRVEADKSMGEKSSLSVSYLGSSGRHLLQNQATLDPESSVLQSLAFTSEGKSHYHALLTQYRTNLLSNLYAQVSYSWSHSIDNGSSDTAPVLVEAGGQEGVKGSSSFDVRQLLSASLSYSLNHRYRPLLRDWTLSGTALARTGFPFDVTTVDRSVGFGFENTGRADLVPGVPVWLKNPNLPGGRELNPNAFAWPADGLSGTLGRNALYGPGLFQMDVSLRRQFRLWRSVSVESAASAFNLLNRPSFANPVNYLGSALFGQFTSMANLMLGAGSPTTGLTPLYQQGGPRTVEVSLRFTF